MMTETKIYKNKLGALHFNAANDRRKAEIIIIGCTFEANNSPSRGGAIYSCLEDTPAHDNMTIINTLFNGNYIGPTTSPTACCPEVGQAQHFECGGGLTLKNVNMTGQHTVADLLSQPWRWNDSSLGIFGSSGYIELMVVSNIPGLLSLFIYILCV